MGGMAILLLLRLMTKDDYAVIDAGEPVGRIRLASERRPQCWMWSVTVCVTGAGNGTAADLDAAKAAFRQSWLPFKTAIGEQCLVAALELARAARERSR